MPAPCVAWPRSASVPAGLGYSSTLQFGDRGFAALVNWSPNPLPLLLFLFILIAAPLA